MFDWRAKYSNFIYPWSVLFDFYFGRINRKLSSRIFAHFNHPVIGISAMVIIIRVLPVMRRSENQGIHHKRSWIYTPNDDTVILLSTCSSVIPAPLLSGQVSELDIIPFYLFPLYSINFLCQAGT